VRIVVRRVIGVIVGTAAVAVSLGGCLFSYDAAKPTMHYVNDSSQDVTVIIEGRDSDYPDEVAKHSSYSKGIGVCIGTGIRVETKSGQLVGRVKEQACPDWTLTVNEDDSLGYVKDE
jgi:hypothetical protein